MYRMIMAQMVVVLAFGTAGCSWAGAGQANYSKFNAYTGIPPHEYEEKGRVLENGWSNYIGFCDRALEFALADALESAKEMGANGLANIKWVTSGEEYDTPHCKCFFWIFWWGAKANVSASAVLTKKTTARVPGVYIFDPGEPSLIEARRILAKMGTD